MDQVIIDKQSNPNDVFDKDTTGILDHPALDATQSNKHHLLLTVMLKLLYISLIFAVLDVMDLAVFSCCTCRSFPAYVSAPKSGCVQC